MAPPIGSIKALTQEISIANATFEGFETAVKNLDVSWCICKSVQMIRCLILGSAVSYTPHISLKTQKWKPIFQATCTLANMQILKADNIQTIKIVLHVSQTQEIYKTLSYIKKYAVWKPQISICSLICIFCRNMPLMVHQ